MAKDFPRLIGYCPTHEYQYSEDQCPYCVDAAEIAAGNEGVGERRVAETVAKYAELVAPVLPTDTKARKDAPIARGVLDYFPRALAAIAELSRVANEQHNPGEPMHWAKEKSNDHADCLVRHLIERGTIDTDGQRHSTKVAWRALANLEIELENSHDERTHAR